MSRYLVFGGGLAVIGSVVAILFVIAWEFFPLFSSPSASRVRAIAPSEPVFAAGLDEYRQVAYSVGTESISFFNTSDGSEIHTAKIPAPISVRVIVAAVSGLRLALGLSDGTVLPGVLRFDTTYESGGRRVVPSVGFGQPVDLGSPARVLAISGASTGPILAAASGTGEVTLVSASEVRALVGGTRRKTSLRKISVPARDEIRALAMDQRGDDLFVGTACGEIVRVDLRTPDSPRALSPVRANQAGQAVSVLGFLLGDRTLIAGDAEGRVSSWQLVPWSRGFELVKMHDFGTHSGVVTGFARSERDRGFMTVDAGGGIKLHYSTTGKTLLELSGEGAHAISMAPKADGFLAWGSRLDHFALKNPHPEASLAGLFGKVWYEGYEDPEYVWQSTGGSDDFESKFSLVPLIFGTIKGTVYAMLFAVPLATLGALYASQFLHPEIKSYVKPVIEIMAALPSVVLGFLAGLWLAPIAPRILPGILLIPPVAAAAILAALWGWRRLPLAVRSRFRPGWEIVLLIPIVVGAGWLALALGGAVESRFLSGDAPRWIRTALGLTYDQRNSLVVGFVMGFAVIPIIFTIAEDALSSVPEHLRAGSLALGATRWQTAVRVVLATASPGIFSAVMVGLGRAVGETMIVLMATGNTPVMDPSPFNGFRAMAANIAVELMDAAEHSTHYRILFLTAFLLFLMTFAVNTAAEAIRLALRRRYQAL